MRRVVRILCLLCNQSWVELLIAIDVSRVNILRWLAVGLLHPLAFLDNIQTCFYYW